MALEAPAVSEAPKPPISRHELAEIDTTVAHSARVYDYLLGGTNNFAVDREVAELQAAAIPGGIERSRKDIRANREFLGRAVRYMAREGGIRQFLDLGTGIPNADNVHGVAQQAAPDAHIVYVDNDPIVLAHAHHLLKSTTEGATAYRDVDLRLPQQVMQLASPTLDFDKPTAVMLVSILHHIPDSDDPWGIVAQYMDAVPSGSYLVVSHLTKDVRPQEMAALEQAPPPDARYMFVLRNRADFTRFFDGLELVDPGVVTVNRWRPDADSPVFAEDPAFYCGVARKE